ncbi:MAG: hypothetical protein FWH54_05190 [Methanobrevibacter sp.]|nr:hypothetical protein [Methanobrevibacter sp.]
MLEIELYTIIIIIAIIVAILIIFAKPFKEKEEEEQEDTEQKTLEDFPAVSKSWVEPMSENHKELLARKENELNYETSEEKTDSSYDENSYFGSKIDNEESFTTDEDDEEEDFSTEESYDEEDFTTEENYHEEDINSYTNNDEEDLNSYTNNNEEIINSYTNNDKEDFTIEENYHKEEFSAEKNNDKTATAKDLSQKQGLKKIATNRNRSVKKSDVAEINMGNKVYELAVKDSIIFSHNNEDYSSYVLDIKHGNVKVKYRSQEKWISFSQIKKIL